MTSARRAGASRKSHSRAAAWLRGWFPYHRRTEGTRQAVAFRHRRAFSSHFEGRQLLAPGIYTVTDLGTLPGGTGSYATGINNSGQVVGYSNISGVGDHAFFYSGGAMADLGAMISGRTYSQATGINDSGQVVGYSYVNNLGGVPQAFLYSGGSMQNLGTLPGGTGSYATGINNSGEVVGSADTTVGQPSGDHSNQAFIYSAGYMQGIGTLGIGDNSSALQSTTAGRSWARP